MLQPDGHQYGNMIRRMRFACWITKARHTLIICNTRWFKYDRDWFLCTFVQISPGHMWTTLYLSLLHYNGRRTLLTVALYVYCLSGWNTTCFSRTVGPFLRCPSPKEVVMVGRLQGWTGLNWTGHSFCFFDPKENLDCKSINKFEGLGNRLTVN